MYLLLPNNIWYVGTINSLTTEYLVLNADKSENDGRYYQLVVPVTSVLAIEYGIDPRGNSYNQKTPDYDDKPEYGDNELSS